MNHLNGQERVGAGLAAGSMLVVGGSVAASSLLGGYPVLGGQGVRYLAAGLLLAVWARLRGRPLPRPAGRDWAWLAGLAIIGLAGCSVLLILATRAANPASVGVVIGTAPLVLVFATAAAAGRRPTRRVLLAAAVVTAGSAAAQLSGGSGTAWSGTGLLLAAGALGGAVGTSLLAAPVLPRLGALAVTIYACGLAGVLLLAAAAVARCAGGPPVLRMPTATELAALSYMAVAVTAVVVLAWYGAMKRLGVDRTGLFNGLIPITALGAVALTGTGTITPLQVLAALTVLAGVILGLGGTPNPDAGRAPADERLARRGLRLHPADQELEVSDFLGQGGAARFGKGDPGAGALSSVALLDADEPGVFQHAEMLGEVARAQLQIGAQIAELHPSCLVRDREDAEPDALVDGVVQAVGGMTGHGAGDRSGRWARAKPMPPSSSTVPPATSCGTRFQDAVENLKGMGNSTTAR